MPFPTPAAFSCSKNAFRLTAAVFLILGSRAFRNFLTGPSTPREVLATTFEARGDGLAGTKGSKDEFVVDESSELSEKEEEEDEVEDEPDESERAGAPRHER
jgi:hypothetical protein